MTIHGRVRQGRLLAVSQRQGGADWVTIAPVGVLIAKGCLLVLLAGCSCSNDMAGDDQLARARQLQEQRRREDELEAKEAAKKAAEKKAAATAQVRSDDAPPPVRRKVRAQRPEKLADWKKKDYLDAKAQRDPRFIEAIQYVGDHFADNPGAAATLVELLRAEGRAPAGSGRRSRRSCRPEEIRALVGALAKNRTETARKALGDVVAGRCATDNDQVAVETVLRLPLAEPTSENEALLFEVLSSPGTPAKDATAAGSKSRLDRVVADVLRSPSLSSRFRQRLAESLCQAGNTSPYVEAIRGSLTEASLSNVPAQRVLLESADLVEVPDCVLSAYFAAYGSAAVCRELGMPPPDVSTARTSGGTAAQVRGGFRRAAEAARAEPEAMTEVTKVIWSEPMAGWVERRLYRLESLDDDGVIVALASTMPIGSTRRALGEALARNWPDGPAGLEGLGLARLVASEPGFVVSLKSAAGQWGKKPRGRASNAGSRRRGVATGTGRGPSEPVGVDERWSALIKEVVLCYCQRIGEAAVRREALTRSSARGPSPPTPPIKLHDRARVIQEYFEEWPEGKTDVAGAARASMRLHFVRCQETIVPERLVRHYQQQLRNADLSADEREAWLTDLRTDESSGWLRSADVFIERANPERALSPNVPEKVSVTVLTVEVPGEPASDASADSRQSRR